MTSCKDILGLPMRRGRNGALPLDGVKIEPSPKQPIKSRLLSPFQTFCPDHFSNRQLFLLKHSSTKIIHFRFFTFSVRQIQPGCEKIRKMELLISYIYTYIPMQRKYLYVIPVHGDNYRVLEQGTDLRQQYSQFSPFPSQCNFDILNTCLLSHFKFVFLRSKNVCFS